MSLEEIAQVGKGEADPDNLSQKNMFLNLNIRLELNESEKSRQKSLDNASVHVHLMND